MDEPISEDELAEWSHDIDLFMEGLTNPDNLEPLLEQSKVKKLWDDSQNKSLTQLDQYLTNTQPTEDSISIEDYMSRWCNIVQTPNSPTPQENHHTTQLFSSEECDNLDKYNQFINDSDQAANRSAIQPDSDKKIESDKESTSTDTTKGEP